MGRGAATAAASLPFATVLFLLIPLLSTAQFGADEKGQAGCNWHLTLVLSYAGFYTSGFLMFYSAVT